MAAKCQESGPFGGWEKHKQSNKQTRFLEEILLIPKKNQKP